MKIINFLSWLFLASSCSSIKLDNVPSECIIQSIESSTEYNGLNENIRRSMNDFNANKKNSVDIVRLHISNGYDYKELFKRIYIRDGAIFIYKDDNTREAPLNEYQDISTFINIKNTHTIITCKEKSSLRDLYRFFVKINGETVMTFWANDLPDKIDKNLIGENLKYIKLFEDL